MKRRQFVQACAAAAGGASLPQAAPAANPSSARMYARARLVDDKGAALRLDTLKPGVNYVFDYPYAATPCFLLRLDRAVTPVELRTEAGQPYRWEGGLGANKSVVAYSAICAHKLTYPTKQVSFIGYRHDPSPVAPNGRVITCCSDRSVYDPAAGARVVSGPAPQPLATILLEQDPRTGDVHAVGTYGGEMFAEFFRRFEFRLQLEMGPRARAAIEGTTVVKELETYSTQWAKC
jgi:arsenite oxidase small subunit